MSVETRGFGRMSDGREAHLVVLSNEAGMRVGVSQVGACLQSAAVPDGRGNLVDVLLGCDGAPGYESNPQLLGAIVGRCANRIAGAAFDLGGTTFHLARNEGENSNHSGPHMWFERLWTIASGPNQTADGGTTVTMGLLSRTGDQGFPGAVDVRVTYTLGADNRLTVHYEAEPSATTIINLTCHAYWNLNGHASGSVLGHTLQLEAERYTPADEHHIPTGQILDVAGTPFDFRAAKALGRDATQAGEGYDANFALHNDECVERVATLVGDETGITMDVLTDAPGLQVYTGRWLDGIGKGGAHYRPFDGVALEAQFYPDAIHHKNFPQPVYAPGHPFVSTTTFAFGTTA